MDPPLTFAAARRHGPERASNLLVPEKNCWRIERAGKLSWLIDGEQYFGAVRTAMANAHSTIFIVGWDIDSRMKLVPTGAHDGLPDALGAFLGALLASRPRLNAYILSWDFALLFALEREWLRSSSSPRVRSKGSSSSSTTGIRSAHRTIRSSSSSMTTSASSAAST